MYKKEIVFEDFNEDTQKGTFHFHLNKVEIKEVYDRYPGGMSSVIEGAIEKGDNKVLLELVKDLVKASYGRVSEGDVRVFEKSPELLKAFVQSNAYSEFVIELVQDPEELARFFRGILPKSVQTAYDEAMEQGAQADSRQELLDRFREKVSGDE